MVDAPDSARGGEVITLAWRVLNAGDATTDVAQWKDYVYLSSDAVLDAGDTKLAEATRSGAVAKDGTYTLSANVFAPNNLSGDYYFLVKADAENLVYEAGLDNNNVKRSLHVTSLSPAPVADLQVTTVVTPADGVPGQTRAVSCRTVTNAGEVCGGGYLNQPHLPDQQRRPVRRDPGRHADGRPQSGRWRKLQRDGSDHPAQCGGWHLSGAGGHRRRQPDLRSAA